MSIITKFYHVICNLNYLHYFILIELNYCIFYYFGGKGIICFVSEPCAP